MSWHVYLGPYVECTYKPTTRTEHVLGCPNPKCVKSPKNPNAKGPYPRGKFCEDCASPIQMIAVQVATCPDHAELTKEALCDMNGGTEELIWLIPNVHRKGAPPRSRSGSDEETHQDLRGVDAEAEIHWFEKAFAEELAILKEHYAKAEIKWGLHQFYL